MDYFKFYFNLFKNQKYLALFDKINQGDYATCTFTLIRSTQKFNFFFIARNWFKTFENSSKFRSKLTRSCHIFYLFIPLRKVSSTVALTDVYKYNRLFIGIGRVARGRRNRHVSFRKTASVCSRRCQNTFQGICRFADNNTPAVKDNVNIANCRLCQNAVCNSVFPSHTG